MTAAPALPKIAHGDLTKDLDLTSEELFALLDLASEVKRSPEFYRSALAGKAIALLFEKPSLRTRMTFELAIQQLGGFALVNEGHIGVREPLKDMARNLDRWVSAIVARTFLQKTVEGLARWSKVPVINALSDMYHPARRSPTCRPSANISEPPPGVCAGSSSRSSATATTWRIR